jgi:hypothetical protein
MLLHFADIRLCCKCSERPEGFVRRLPDCKQSVDEVKEVNVNNLSNEKCLMVPQQTVSGERLRQGEYGGLLSRGLYFTFV